MTELGKALVAAQKALPPVDKDGTNPHFHSDFVTLDNLIAKTRPVLNDHGLAINQFPSVSDLGAPVLVTRITHVSGESIEYPMALFLGKQDMQGLGAAITYARRFAWASALGIASDGDDDGNTAVQQAAPPANTGTISDAQRRRLFAIAGEKSVLPARVKEIVNQVTGSESTSAIPTGKYDEIVALIEAEDVPF